MHRCPDCLAEVAMTDTHCVICHRELPVPTLSAAQVIDMARAMKEPVGPLLQAAGIDTAEFDLGGSDQ